MTTDPQNDFRYPLTVFLMRENRPNYWEFHCPFCTAKVCEIDGTIIQVRDISNDESEERSLNRVRCPGTSRKFCRLWFEFVGMEQRKY